MSEALNYFLHETYLAVPPSPLAQPSDPEDQIYVTTYRPFKPEFDGVVLHLQGYRDSADDPKAIAIRNAALAAGASFVTLDHRGHGKSLGVSRNEGLQTYLADAFLAASHVLHPSEDVMLTGHSIGGLLQFPLAKQIEQTRPDNRIAAKVSIAPVHGLMRADALGHRIYMRGGNTELAGPNKCMTNIYARELVYSDLFVEDYRKMDLVARPPQNITYPVTFVVSSKDAFVPKAHLDAVAGAIPTSQVIYCEGAEHTMKDERTLSVIGDVVGSMIQANFKRVSPEFAWRMPLGEPKNAAAARTPTSTNGSPAWPVPAGM